MEYSEVRQQIGNQVSHLLLGNGFSVGCDPIFAYASLYTRAVERGLSARAQEVFARLGTNNFEGVMHLLSNAHWVARTYGLIDGEGSLMLEDLEVVKTALVSAIADSHPATTGDVSDAKKTAARAFFEAYKNIFTTNYDLLAYWVVLSDPVKPRHLDCFAEDPEDPDGHTVVYSFRLGSARGLLHLHGGLHLFTNLGHVTKHCWSRSGQPLTTLIRRGLEEGQYPLFVAEGSPDKKLEQIYRSGYLSYCLEKLGRIKKNLVVFGSSLGENDDHIRKAIAANKDLKRLYISVRDADNTVAADAAAARIRQLRADLGLDELAIEYCWRDTANVWG